jgi:o-succinylbenzoate synthase
MRCRLLKRHLKLAAPLMTAQGPISERTVWVVALDDGAGRVGLGEAAPLAGFGSETPEQCREVFNTVLKALTGEFILNWLDRGRPDAPLGPLEKMLGGAPCARSAIEGALLDLAAKQIERPLATFLSGDSTGAPVPMSVPVNALLGGSLQEVTAGAAELVKSGFTSFKLKVGGPTTSVAADVERVFAVRDTIGADAKLRVDANCAWTLEQALEFAVEVADANLEFCEQPLPAADLEGMATLRRRSGMKIAVDEAVRTAADIGRVASAQAADVVVLKPMFLGGWRPTKQAAELATSCGLGVVITTALEGAIGRAHATHMAAAIGLNERAQGLGTGILIAEDLTASPLVVIQGVIPIPAEPRARHRFTARLTCPYAALPLGARTSVCAATRTVLIFPYANASWIT